MRKTNYGNVCKSILIDSYPEKKIKDYKEFKYLNHIEFYFKLNPLRVPCLVIDNEFKVSDLSLFYFKLFKDKIDKETFFILLPEDLNLNLKNSLIRDKKLQLYSFNELNDLYLNPLGFYSTITFKQSINREQEVELKKDVLNYYALYEWNISNLSYNKELNTFYFKVNKIGSEQFELYKSFLFFIVKKYGYISLVDSSKNVRGISIYKLGGNGTD